MRVRRQGFNRKLGPIDWKSANRRAEEALAGVSCDFDTTTRISDLPRTEKSLVAIARALAAAGVSGDGSEAAFQRIRGSQYQVITVAELLNLQGWQLVDELNRADFGVACSGYVTAPALVTAAGLKASGDSNQFDPQNGYREAHAKIRGK